jgi:DNA-binding MarR family transcriptional regulator
MKNALDTASLASLILSLLAHDDAQTARELADAIGTTAAALRPALRQLVESGDVVTSGRAGATRYVLAVVEQVAAPVQQLALEVTPAVQEQRSERSSTASLVLADEEPAKPARKPRAARPVIPATVDILGALQATQQRLESGATLHELSARPAPVAVAPLRREALHPAEQVTGEDQAREQWTAEQDESARRRGIRQLVGNAALALVALLPVAWTLAHLAR